MASAEYNAGGSDKAANIIDSMDGPELKNGLLRSLEKIWVWV